MSGRFRARKYVTPAFAAGKRFGTALKEFGRSAVPAAVFGSAARYATLSKGFQSKNNASTRMNVAGGWRQYKSANASGTGKQISVAGNESKSKYADIHPRPKGKGLKLLGVHTLNRSSGISFASTQGKQNAAMCGSYFDQVDCQNIYTSLGQTATGQNATKVLLLTCKAQILITNAESTNSHFTIYNLQSKLGATTNNPDPVTVFLAGNVDAVGGAAADATIPGTYPGTNPRFKACYKIKKITPIILAPGATHTHNVYYYPNRIYGHEKDKLLDIAGGGIAGLTQWTMIIQSGTPVHDATSETLVTIGLSKLDIVVMEEIQYQACLYNYPINSITTTLATNLTPEQMQDINNQDAADIS